MIVVLTLGRSGSSLLMQTLDALGCDVIGRKFDQHGDAELQARHIGHNPKGYYEEPDIYYRGAKSPTFQTQLREMQRPSACKMDLRHFTDPDQTDEWNAAAPFIQAIFVSFRHPVEQAQSEFRAAHTPEDAAEKLARFQFITNFLADYRDAMVAIEESMCDRGAPLSGRIHAIEYAEASHAESYVEKICKAAGLAPSADQSAAAISNISPELFRVKAENLPPDEHEWANGIGAMEAYARLSENRDSA